MLARICTYVFRCGQCNDNWLPVHDVTSFEWHTSDCDFIKGRDATNISICKFRQRVYNVMIFVILLIHSFWCYLVNVQFVAASLVFFFPINYFACYVCFSFSLLLKHICWNIIFVEVFAETKYVELFAETAETNKYLLKHMFLFEKSPNLQI